LMGRGRRSYLTRASNGSATDVPIDDCGLIARNEMIVTWFNQRGRVWLSKCRCSSTPPSTIAGPLISESNEPRLASYLSAGESVGRNGFGQRIRLLLRFRIKVIRSVKHLVGAFNAPTAI
jgi:hypothetical protein